MRPLSTETARVVTDLRTAKAAVELVHGRTAVAIALGEAISRLCWLDTKLQTHGPVPESHTWTAGNAEQAEGRARTWLGGQVLEHNGPPAPLAYARDCWTISLPPERGEPRLYLGRPVLKGRVTTSGQSYWTRQPEHAWRFATREEAERERVSGKHFPGGSGEVYELAPMEVAQ